MKALYSLREFIYLIERHGELVRVTEPVSLDLEIAAISDMEMKRPGGGKALLFENVSGHEMPVLVNGFGSRKRMELAFGEDVEKTAGRIRELVESGPPSGWADAIKKMPQLFELRSVLPKKVKHPPCQDVVLTGEAIDLTKIPVLKCWPNDGGPFVTLPCVVTRDPETGRRNVGMYRLQIFDERTTGMHWHIHKDGSLSHRQHTRTGERMEAAVAIGTDPVVTYCATAPLPRGVDEMMLAGFIRKKPVELAKCVTVDLEVPATAEIVLEGYVEPGETRIEGPFGDHTGVYSPADPYPVFHVTAITHRKDPVYFTTVVGIPPMEDEWLGWATERLFLPLMRTQWPEVKGMHLPVEGVFHNWAQLAIRKDYPLQPRRLMSGLWGAGQMSFSKMIAVVDDDVDPTNTEAFARRLLDLVNPERDLTFTEGVLDALDHSSPTELWGSKLGVDGTRKVQGEVGYGEEPAAKVEEVAAEELLSKLKEQFGQVVDCRLPLPGTRLTLALIVIDKDEPGLGAEVAAAGCDIKGVDVAVVVEGVGSDPLSLLAWRVLSSVDPARDVKVATGKVAIDGTTKSAGEGHGREWPEEVSHPGEVVELAKETASKAGLII